MYATYINATAAKNKKQHTHGERAANDEDKEKKQPKGRVLLEWCKAEKR